MTRLIALLVMLAALTGCSGPRVSGLTARDALVRLAPSQYPDFTDYGQTSSLAQAVGCSLGYLGKLPPDSAINFGQDTRTASQLIESLTELKVFLQNNPSPAALKDFISTRFDVYAANGGGDVFFTGYYTPELAASAAPDEVYKYPLYAKPDFLLTADLGLFKERLKGEKLVGMVNDGRFVPFYTRREIDSEGALKGKGLELAWVADPVDAFFLQVQGSGVLIYPDGASRHVNYAGANGRAYRSVGKLLIDRGKADASSMSMRFIRDYIRAHPEEAREILDYNESFVFFRLEDDGPYGSLGAAVTGMRTVATDMGYYPPGALVFVQTETPVFSGHLELVGWSGYSGFALNQDTGGAIKGPGRADFYFGYGEPAKLKAGYMKRPGRMYFLVGGGSSRQ